MGLVYGIGKTDIKTSTNGLRDREYIIWKGMISRCYNIKEHIKHPTYKECTVSDEWLTYSNFKKDYMNMVGCKKTWQLDKDLLFKFNTVYSIENCILLPQEINTLITNNRSNRGNLPIGVSISPNKSKLFISHCKIGGGKVKHIGVFESAYDAFIGYKRFKEDFIKQQAFKYKNVIDDRAYNALMKYNVDIND